MSKPLPYITCPRCYGDGSEVARITGTVAPCEETRECRKCGGYGAVPVMCSVCIHELATTVTGDADLPFACDECAVEFVRSN